MECVCGGAIGKKRVGAVRIFFKVGAGLEGGGKVKEL